MANKVLSSTSALRVGTLLYDNFLGTSATLPVEMLRTAQASARARDPNARQIAAVTLSIDHQ
ncbi:MAG: hypothetical protein V7725_07935, partial [Porticoccus sp.]